MMKVWQKVIGFAVLVLALSGLALAESGKIKIEGPIEAIDAEAHVCLLYTSPSPRD